MSVSTEYKKLQCFILITAEPKKELLQRDGRIFSFGDLPPVILCSLTRMGYMVILKNDDTEEGFNW